MSEPDPIVDVEIVAGTPAAVTGGVGDSGRSAPWWLWAAAVAVLLPVGAAVAFLFLRAFGATDSAW